MSVQIFNRPTTRFVNGKPVRLVQTVEEGVRETEQCLNTLREIEALGNYRADHAKKARRDVEQFKCDLFGVDAFGKALTPKLRLHRLQTMVPKFQELVEQVQLDRRR